MKNRKLLIGIGVLVLAVVVLWACFPASVSGSDAARYRRWKHVPVLYKRAVWWKKRLPPSLAQALHLSTLPSKYIDERQRLAAALVASGYLTNIIIAPGSDSVQPAAMVAFVQKAYLATDAWEVSLRREGLVITCRPEDAARCMQFFQK